MPNLSVMTPDGKFEKVIEVNAGTRLVNALEENGIDVLHRCGGHAKCTTCRVQFVEGAPHEVTLAQQEIFKKPRDTL